MGKSLKRIIFCGSAFLLIAISIGCTQQNRELEERSEKRFNKLQPPEKIMDAIGLKPGMVIGDIGAGEGRFTVWFAQRVGESGKVYANDINERALRYLEKRCTRHGYENVIIRLGKVVEPNIPDGALDIAFMIDVYHHLDMPVELLKNIAPALKSNGTLVIVENDPEKSGWTSHTTPKTELLKQVDKAGYELVKIDPFLPMDNIYFFRPKAKDNGS
jgi:ubiquinone/menaquinone biosynthesis C-methylase UbiE